MNHQEKTTTLVIPHFNDTERLEVFLPKLAKILPEYFEIIVSDDGSSPDERRKLSHLIHEVQRDVGSGGAQLRDALFHERNTGKGGAVLRGWLASSQTQNLGFVDADGAVGVEEIVRGTNFFHSTEGAECDALFANRVKMLGRNVHRSLKRHFSGRIFATIVSNLGKTSAYDTQCGFKLLRREAFTQIAPYLKTPGFAFDVELCLLLQKFGFHTIEFPVDWSDIPGSKVRLVRDGLGMAVEVIRIRRRVDAIKI
jgi:dolichyl-phosphate beta-glucosyltransferase